MSTPRMDLMGNCPSTQRPIYLSVVKSGSASLDIGTLTVRCKVCGDTHRLLPQEMYWLPSTGQRRGAGTPDGDFA